MPLLTQRVDRAKETKPSSWASTKLSLGIRTAVGRGRGPCIPTAPRTNSTTRAAWMDVCSTSSPIQRSSPSPVGHLVACLCVRLLLDMITNACVCRLFAMFVALNWASVCCFNPIFLLLPCTIITHCLMRVFFVPPAAAAPHEHPCLVWSQCHVRPPYASTPTSHL